MANIDQIIIITYLGVCLLIGLSKASKIKSIKEYTLGKRQFPTAVLIATTFATTIGVVETVGAVGKTYEMGIVFAIPRLIAPLAWVMMGYIMAYSIEEFRGCLTLSDIMEKMYGPMGRWFTNVAALMITLGVLAASITAMGEVLSYFMGLSDLYGIIIAVVIIITYSAFGGIQGVALTDVFQFMIFFIAFPVACSIGFHDVGGLSGIFEKLPQAHKIISKDQYSQFASLILYAIIPMTGIPMIQRALMTQSEKELRKVFGTVALLTLPFVILVMMMGLIAYIKNPDLKPDLALFYFIDTYLPAGITGLMVASILAVIMSTVDSFLNTTSVLCARDIVKQIAPKCTDAQELLVARASTLVLAFISIFIARQDKGIQDILWFIDNFWDPIISIPLLLGMLKVRPGIKAYNYSILASVSTIFITRYITGEFNTISLSIGAITSASMLIIFANYKASIRLQKY